MCDLIIDRGNFKDIRMKYHINQKDIAKRANISASVICDYEKHNTGRLEDHIETKDCNEKMIIRALMDMIDEGYRSASLKGGRVAGMGKKYVANLKNLANEPDNEYLTVMDHIKVYLFSNDMTAKEFSDMIGCSRRIFEIGYNRGRKVSDQFKKKLEDATGWRYEDILSGKINEGGKEKMNVPVKKTIDDEDLDVKAEAIKECSPSTQDILLNAGEELPTVGEVFDSLDEKTKKYIYKEVDDAINKTITEEQERYLKQDHKAAIKTWEKSLGIKPVNVFDVEEVVKQQAEIITDMVLGGATKPELEAAINNSMNAIRNAVDYSNYEIRNKKYSYFPESDDCVLSYELVKKFSRRISKEEFMEGVTKNAKTEKS